MYDNWTWNWGEGWNQGLIIAKVYEQKTWNWNHCSLSKGDLLVDWNVRFGDKPPGLTCRFAPFGSVTLVMHCSLFVYLVANIRVYFMWLLWSWMATHSSILAWRIPWMEEPGRLQTTGSQRVGQDWATSLSHSLIWKAPKTSNCNYIVITIVISNHMRDLIISIIIVAFSKVVQMRQEGGRVQPLKEWHSLRTWHKLIRTKQVQGSGQVNSQGNRSTS